MANWMLYGANGYTGQLMVEEAARRGEKPILAGRRAEVIRPLAERHGLEYRVFDLDEVGAIAARLADVDAISLAAGPFSATSAKVVEACLASGTHYTDITGEVDVFEACAARDAEAKQRSVTIMPGVGFDVVPTDCVAAALHRALPDAHELVLAFRSLGASSRGTTKTMIEALPHGGKVRRDGRLVSVPTAHETRDIPFRDKTRLAVSIPWGDVSTAFQSTGIPNITVFVAVPAGQVRAMKAIRRVGPALGLPLVQRALKGLVEATLTGPDQATRERGSTQVWGRASTKDGRSVEATLTTPEGYTLTARTAVDATIRCARGEVKAGAMTPSLAFGADYITQFEGCDLQVGAVR